MTKKISALTAVSTVAAANEFEVNESGTSKKATALQIANYVRGLGGQFLLFRGAGLNFNSTADQALTAIGTLPSRWRVANVIVTNASTSLTTAAGGIYSAISKGGTAIVLSSQAYTACTAASKFTSASINGSLADTFGASQAVYLSLTTGQGSAATADVYLIGQVLEV